MDALIVRLEHLHHLVPQPLTYYTADVKNRKFPCTKNTAFCKQLLLPLLNGAFTLSYFSFQLEGDGLFG